MLNELNIFKEMIQKEEKRKIGIQQEIEKQRKELIELGDKYESAIINDEDSAAESYQQKMSEIHNSLKRNEDKLNLMNQRFVTAELNEQADKVLQEANNGLDELNEKANKLAEEYHELREKMIEKAREIGENKRLDYQYIAAVNYVANRLPEWAKKQYGIDYSEYSSPGNRYKYNRIASTPNLKPFDYTQLEKVKGGMDI